MERSEIIKICEGLEIDLQSFENYLDSIYSQDISSEKIQDILINYAVSMTSFEESDWTYLAGKLLMRKTQNEVLKNRGFSYGNFYETIKKMVELGVYDSRLKEYGEEEIRELERR